MLSEQVVCYAIKCGGMIQFSKHLNWKRKKQGSNILFDKVLSLLTYIFKK